jgi:hypothetical protein
VSDVANYVAFEPLRSGRQIEIRSLRPGDREDMLAAIEQTSAQSLYRRFFGPKHHFTEQEVSFFLDIDFINHVALVAFAQEDDQRVIVGEQLELMAVRREHARQLNDQRAKHDAELAGLRQQVAAARVATADLQALNASWHRRLRECDACRICKLVRSGCALRTPNSGAAYKRATMSID